MSKFVLTAQLQLQAPRNTQQVINQLRGQLQGAVNIPVNVQGAVQATKQINQVNQAAQKATTAGERMGKAFGASIKRFAAFNIATRAVGLFASKLSQAVDESIAFQRELIKISQVTGRTVSELENLTGTITKLSTTLGVSSTSLLQTSRILAQAGIEARDLDVALSALAKTTLAPTFDNITETAEGAVAILAQFGQGVGALESQLGAINAVAGQFAVESGDLISAVRRTGGVFRQAGGDLNELLGLFTSVRATTRENAESIATGLRTIFTRIQRPQTIEYLKQFGVQLTDLEGRFVGPFEAVRQLSTALAGLEQGDIRFVQIAEELGGFRQIGKVIPLIQQFEVAERARQAAIDGGNSLTEDAATAQQALAVQIEKTREKFLALIRSISETSTFQIMIKSVLGIANAFIKVAESIKPLIPLIAAFAAVKLTRGLGSFVSGIGAGVRGKNQGGQIHAFASGGFVPGTGNRDTVPAMLTPGEFVIRKSSVNKIGADTLAAMNENKYAKGGKIQINPGAIGGFFLRPEQGDPRDIPVDDAITVSGPKALQALGHEIKNKNISRRNALLSVDKATQARLLFGRTGLRQGKVLKKRLTDKDFTSGSTPTLRSANKSDFGPEAFAAFKNTKTQERIDRNVTRGNISGGSLTVPIDGSITGFFPGGDDLKKNAKVARIVKRQTQKGLFKAVEQSVAPINKILDIAPTIDFNEGQVRKAGRRIAKDANAAATTQGFVYEGVIQGITGAKLAGGTSNFDFPSSSISGARPALQALFSSGDEGISRLIKGDAKRSNTAEAKKSIINKIKNDVNKGLLEGLSFVKKASGGGISGSDTVPAMLTPGEFVINKKASQSIGYGNLNRMNKQGVVGYANGGPVGPVQYFQEGTDGTGVKDIKIPAVQAVLYNLEEEFKQVGDLDFGEIDDLAERLKQKIEEALVAVADAIDTDNIISGQADFDSPKTIESQDFQAVRSQAQARVQEQATTRKQQLQNESIGSLGVAPSTPTAPTEDDTNILKQILAAVKASGDQIENSIKTHGVATGGTAATVESPAAEQQVQKLTGQTTFTGVRAGSAGSNEKLEKQIAAKTQEVVNAYNKRIEQIHELNAESDEEIISSEKLQVARADFKKKLEEQAKEAIESGDVSKIGKGADTEARKLTKKAKSGSNQGSEAEKTQANLQKMAALAGASVAATTAITSFAESTFGAESAITDVASSLAGTLNTIVVGFTSVSGVIQSLGVDMSDFSGAIWKAITAQTLETTAEAAAAPVQVAETAAEAQGTLSQVVHTAAVDNDTRATLLNTGSKNVKGIGDLFTGLGTKLKGLATPMNVVAGAAAVAGIALYTWADALSKDAKRRMKKAEDKGDLEGFLKSAGAFSEAETEKKFILAGAGIGAVTGGVLGGAAAGGVTGGLAAAGGAVVGATKGAGYGAVAGKFAFKIAQWSGLLADSADILVENADKIREISYKGVEKALSDNAKAIDLAAKEMADGIISSAEAAKRFDSVAMEEYQKQDKFLADTFKAAQKKQQDAFYSGADADELKEFEDTKQEVIKQRRDNAVKLVESRSQFTNKQMEDVAIGGGSFDDFKKALGEDVVKLYQQAGQLDLLEQQYKNQVKAIQENIKYLQALNFGFRDVAGKAMAISGSMDRLIASQESGFNAFDQSLQILEQSLTEAAVGMDPKQIAAAADNLEKTLVGFGADPKVAKEASDTVKGLSTAQAGAGKALETAAKKLIGPGGGLKSDPKAVEKEFKTAVEGQLAGLNLPQGVKDRILNGLGNVDFGSKEVQEQLRSGNFSALIDQSFGPLSEEIKKQLLGPYQERAKQEGILINLTKQRIQLEQQANEAKKKAIDIELEAAQAIEDFGGRQLTAADKISFVNRKLDVDLKAAGVRGVGSGSANELAAVQQNILADFNNLQNEANVAAQRGTGAFGGVGGAEKDKRPQLEAAQQALIEATRQRISLIKEELEIVKRKNELEKQSLDKLLSGDIEGFFADQAATGAASALRTGNQALIGSFSASAIGAGLKDLQGQNLAPQQMERIASGAFRSLGIQDRRSGQIFAGNTAEEQRLRQEGQQLAGILGAAGAGAAQIAEMAVDAQTVVINAARAEMGNAANVPQPQFRATGGMIYANRGMFVPRGTDTVPAMLTPGEFVVNRAAVQRGNNMAILQAMNNGQQASGPAMSRGGTVRYYRDGGDVSGGGMGISMEVANKMAGSLNGFVTAVDKLGQMQLSVKLDTTNVNVNFNGTSFLANLSENIKTEVLNEVRRQIPNIQHSGTGGHQLGGGSVMGS